MIEATESIQEIAIEDTPVVEDDEWIPSNIEDSYPTVEEETE